MKTTQEDYKNALKVIKSYNPDKYVDTKKIEMKNTASGQLARVVLKDGMLLLLTPSGEVLPYQVSLDLHENVNEMLSATCKLLVEFHEIIK